MNEKLRKSVVFASLIGALILAYFHFGDRNEKTDTRQTAPRTIQTANVAAPSTAISTVSMETIQEYETLSWGKNPFYHSHRPVPAQADSKNVELHLLGILYRQVNAQALINNTVVQEGDSIADYVVEKIARDHVTVSNDKTTRTLTVEQEG